MSGSETGINHERDYLIRDFDIANLTSSFILRLCPYVMPTHERGYFQIFPERLAINSGAFTNSFLDTITFPEVEVELTADGLRLSCDCKTPKKLLCDHQAQVLYNIMERKDIRLFFDKPLRHDYIRKHAVDYGLGETADPDAFFELEYHDKSVEIKPRIKELLPVNRMSRERLEEQLLPRKRNSLTTETPNPQLLRFIVFTQNRFRDHFCLELYEAQRGKDDKLKNPLSLLNPLDSIWKLTNADELKFYSSISRFQNQYRKASFDSDVDALRALIRNPLNIPVYYHNLKVSESLSANALVPVRVKNAGMELRLSVNVKDDFYEVEGQLTADGISLDLAKLTMRFDYFLQIADVFYLLDNADVLRVIEYFRKNNNRIVIHGSKFADFQSDILSKLESKIRITYSYLKSATPEQKEENGFNRPTEQLIYLSDEAEHVIISPYMMYGNAEVPVFSKKQIYSLDGYGKPFTVDRDDNAELQFISFIMNQHPDFQDQIDLGYFYLPKSSFLDEGWFLNAFEEWGSRGITVLGFSELKGNKLNSSKAKISVSVISGINWFDTTIKLQFGKQEVSLKHLQKSIRNKSKYVQLGDGTLGILPAEWLEKFAGYFSVGEIHGEKLRTPRINFSDIATLYDQEVLSEEVKNELGDYAARFSTFESIEAVKVPTGLNATLREYQKEGLNWLNFLDEFGFGGCLADDMGLGKTIQVIAFLLTQKAKKLQANLIVVPTSLLFNWEAELEKFAPSLRVLPVYGQSRAKSIEDFERYDVVLTSYGTLLSDVQFVKNYHFNYIFLDESQAIKNPESQRYKMVRLLHSRNKIVLTGTPIENNTFDLYGQLSFACPGLLGTKHQFKSHFSTPIDRFQDRVRAQELQRRVNPFILRRTKKQVATELPEKTEMVLYCEMGEEQRKVYNAYEKEFRNFLNTKEEGDLERNRMHILQGLTKLRQLCNSPALLNDDEFYGTSSSKITVLLEQIESQAKQHKLLIFSQFVGMLDLIKKELVAKGVGFEYLTGQTNNREKHVENFQNNPEVRVFLISLKAGGTGLNLTEADYVYLVDPWWNPAVENQAIDRSYRIGQDKNVVAVRLICPDTIEEKIMHLQDLKRGLADELVKTDNDLLKSLSKSDLLGLLH